jgi:hypothetical protein
MNVIAVDIVFEMESEEWFKLIIGDLLLYKVS